jgi:hypothetical protein
VSDVIHITKINTVKLARAVTPSMLVMDVLQLSASFKIALSVLPQIHAQFVLQATTFHPTAVGANLSAATQTVSHASTLTTVDNVSPATI